MFFISKENHSSENRKFTRTLYFNKSLQTINTLLMISKCFKNKFVIQFIGENMNLKKEDYIQILLRIGIAGTFFGHGYYAFNGKEEWIPLIEAYGFSRSFAYEIIPFIGIMDMLIALTILIKPLRVIVIWATIWAFATALSRPLSGMDILEMIERSSNWVLPLILLLFLGLPKSYKDLIKSKKFSI